MALLEIGFVALAIFFALACAGLLLAMFFLYSRFKNKLLETKPGQLDKSLREHITKVNEARANDRRELTERLDALEEKLNVALSPEGQEKELAKEKIKARAK